MSEWTVQTTAGAVEVDGMLKVGGAGELALLERAGGQLLALWARGVWISAHKHVDPAAVGVTEP